MNIKDLKSGDVLLFSAEKGSFISWAITFLTKAPVSHAAMFYNEKESTIIEETPPQVAINNANERFKGRDIYVRRLNKNLPLTPVIETSTSYLNDKEPYDDKGLYMVGVLLMYKRFTPNTIVQKAIVKILKKITFSINKYINEHKNPNKLPMVCSQFVAQCYAKAGDEYQLKIDSGILSKTLESESNSHNIISQVIQKIDNGERINAPVLLASSSELKEETFLSGEELCKELKEALEISSNETFTGITHELTEAVCQFSHAHHCSNLITTPINTMSVA